MPEEMQSSFDSAAASQFLEALFRSKPEDHYVCLWTLPAVGSKSEQQTYFSRSIPDIVTAAKRLSKDNNVYFGCGTRKETFPSPKRGKANDVTGIPGLWLDIDIADGAAHKSESNFPDIDTAHEFLKRLGLPPSVLVHSGHGLQAYWLFDSFFDFQNDSQPSYAAAIARDWTLYAQQVAGQMGYTVDSTGDLARVFRLPGAMNLKVPGQPVPCRILEICGKRYSDRALEEHCRKFLHNAESARNTLRATSSDPQAESISVGYWLDKYVREATPGNRHNSGLRLALQLGVLRVNGLATMEECEACIREFGKLTDRPGDPYTDSEVRGAMDIVKNPKYTETPARSKAARKPSTPEQQSKAETAIQEALAKRTADAVYAVAGSLALLSDGKRDDLLKTIKKGVPSVDLRTLKGKISQSNKTARDDKKYKYTNGITAICVDPMTALRETGKQTIFALRRSNRPEYLFVRGGFLVRCKEDEHGQPIIEFVTDAILGSRIADVVDFVCEGEEGDRLLNPPKDVIRYVMSQQRLPFPALEGVTETPVLRKDGTIFAEPGYDVKTGYLYKPADGFSMPAVADSPTTGDVCSALDLLREAVCDFPFVDEASMANTIALMLTPLLSPVVGKTPLTFIDATKWGTGKSLLADIVSIIACGRSVAFTTAPSDKDEWRKKITAILQEGKSFVVLDNLKSAVISESLAALLTMDRWTDRILGRSENISLVNRATWVVTGNNVETDGEIARRTVLVQLDARCSRPHERAHQFKHEELKEWVVENRGRLVAALFTLIRAWYAAGKPAAKTPKMGSFETWVKTVGSILAHVGINGFHENREILLAKSDAESTQWEGFLYRWLELYGDQPKTVSQMKHDLTTAYGFEDVVPDDVSRAIVGTNVNPNKVGKAFRSKLGTRFGNEGVRLVSAGTSHKVALWTVAKDEAPCSEQPCDLEDDLAGCLATGEYESGAAGAVAPDIESDEEFV